MMHHLLNTISHCTSWNHCKMCKYGNVVNVKMACAGFLFSAIPAFPFYSFILTCNVNMKLKYSSHLSHYPHFSRCLKKY